MLAAIEDPLRAFYEAHLENVIATGEPWEHDYECSSAELFRQFHLRALALGNHAGVLITHSLRIEHPHADAGQTLLPAALTLLYHGDSGLMSNADIAAECDVSRYHERGIGCHSSSHIPRAT